MTSLGWRPHHEQVGQTGSKVSPQVYIACGISGAIQHWVGMSSAQTILAVNTDAEAPMVTKAHYAVIGDLHEVVPGDQRGDQTPAGVTRARAAGYSSRELAGRVVAVRSYPVKSMDARRCSRLPRSAPAGLAGDRAWSVVGADGAVVSARRLPALRDVRATAAARRPAAGLPGAVAGRSSGATADAALSAYLGVAGAAPAGRGQRPAGRADPPGLAAGRRRVDRYDERRPGL